MKFAKIVMLAVALYWPAARAHSPVMRVAAQWNPTGIAGGSETDHSSIYSSRFVDAVSFGAYRLSLERGGHLVSGSHRYILRLDSRVIWDKSLLGRLTECVVSVDGWFVGILEGDSMSSKSSPRAQSKRETFCIVFDGTGKEILRVRLPDVAPELGAPQVGVPIEHIALFADKSAVLICHERNIWTAISLASGAVLPVRIDELGGVYLFSVMSIVPVAETSYCAVSTMDWRRTQIGSSPEFSASVYLVNGVGRVIASQRQVAICELPYPAENDYDIFSSMSWRLRRGDCPELKSSIRDIVALKRDQDACWQLLLVRERDGRIALELAGVDCSK